MNYTLAVLTHGRAPHLLGAVASFADRVSPAPASAVIHADGADAVEAARRVCEAFPSWPWTLTSSARREGFCAATGALWAAAAAAGPGWVYWLEHDFLHVRPVDLAALAAVLDVEPGVAQMALCRGPVNPAEVAAGGVVASRPGEFVARETLGHGWLEQRSYWTTNPSLFRAAVASRYPWPAGPECEGVFGARLRADGASFGMWSGGEPWVEHVGVRDGFGY